MTTFTRTYDDNENDIFTHQDFPAGENDKVVVFSLGGRDRVFGTHGGESEFHLGEGGDSASGSDKTSVLYGEGGDDVLGNINRSGANFDASDSMYGGTGEDRIFSRGDNIGNLIDGGEDNDVLNISSFGTDTIIGGAGDRDYVILSKLTGEAGVSMSLATGGSSGSAVEGDSYSGVEGVEGTTGHDQLGGNNGDNTLVGKAGVDTILGEGGSDLILGNTFDFFFEDWRAYRFDPTGAPVLTIDDGAADSLSGGARNDTLIGGYGGDTLDGGAGVDVVSYIDSAEGVEVSLASGTGTGGSAQGDTLIGVENLTGSHYRGSTGAGDDTLTGNSASNTIRGLTGADLLFGLGGADSLVGDENNDTLDGGAGADTMSGGAGRDVYYVDSQTDKIVGEASSEDESQSDTVISQVSFKLAGALENLTLTGRSDLTGEGNASGNVIAGNRGANSLGGLAGDDTLTGGDGADTLTGGADADSLDGGTGVDTASYANAGAAVTADLTTPSNNLGDAFFDAYVSIENLVGSNYRDSLTGNTGANRLEGGRQGDTLSGGAGADTLVGGSQSDTLIGGTGPDAFLFDAPLDVSFDSIEDFSTVNDLILLDDAVFADIGGLGALDPEAFSAGDGRTALEDDDRVIYDLRNGRLYYDADGLGGEAEKLFAILVAKPQDLSAADFQIV